MPSIKRCSSGKSEAWDPLSVALTLVQVRDDRLGQSSGRGLVRSTGFWLCSGGRAEGSDVG